MMRDEDREWLAKAGYQTYAYAPVEKWRKDAGGCAFYIRACDEYEELAYQANYSAKIHAGDRRTITYFGDDVKQLHDKMLIEASQLDDSDSSQIAQTATTMQQIADHSAQ